MSDFSLRLPYLIYLSVGSILLGVLLAPLFRPTPVLAIPENTRDHAMMHGSIEIPPEGAPEIAIEVTKDPMDGWNVRVITENFTFIPPTVNAENIPNTGHAHLYVNNVKIARLYGAYFHLTDLPVGDHEVSVSLSSNDHSYFLVRGEKIAARAVITQEQSGPAGG